MFECPDMFKGFHDEIKTLVKGGGKLSAYLKKLQSLIFYYVTREFFFVRNK